MIAAFAFTLAATTATQLGITPWTGKVPPTVTSAATKYHLTVSGKPNATLTLRVTHLAKGWLGAFCTPTVCSPESVDVTLSDSGHATYAFELIREDDKAPKHTAATIESSDGATLSNAP